MPRGLITPGNGLATLIDTAPLLDGRKRRVRRRKPSAVSAWVTWGEDLADRRTPPFESGANGAFLGHDLVRTRRPSLVPSGALNETVRRRYRWHPCDLQADGIALPPSTDRPSPHPPGLRCPPEDQVYVDG